MAARQLGVIVTDAVSYQNERKRQLALAELDRARTEFFQNVTHELRAPLTMLLTPLQDILDEPGVVLSAATRTRLRRRYEPATGCNASSTPCWTCHVPSLVR